MPHPMHLHRHTPTIAAIDARGLRVLTVAYHGREPGKTAEWRPWRQTYDATGRLRAQWDARLWADGGEAGEPNQSTRYSTSGRPLQTVSVDAGWRMALLDEAGQACEAWDGRGLHRWIEYDEQLRPVSVHEQNGTPKLCVERFTYGDITEMATNGCGRIIRHDDSAGRLDFSGYSLCDGVLAATRRFLAELTAPDWPVASLERDALLETDTQGVIVTHITRWQCDASGAPWQQTDAAGHVRRTCFDIAGQSLRVDLQPAGGAPLTLVRDMTYDAFGRAIGETAGNSVVTLTGRSRVDGRLQHRQVARPEHLLLDVNYTYDAVGNITRIEDRAQPTTWFDGARVDSICLYGYDTLYQLISATGRESVQATIGPMLPGLVLPGGGAGSCRRAYMQSYVCDAGANLRTLSHTASDQTQYTRTMAVAARSNRSMFRPEGAPPPDFIVGFDANGNQQDLDGQAMTWGARNQLQRMTQLVREAGTDDEETYVYDGDGMRLRKRRTTQGKAVTHVEEARYLPGVVLHWNTSTGETWEVVSVPAGCSVVRWLRWRTQTSSPQLRYRIDDHLGSCTLELDEQANVISHEGYYPFGGTAWWAARSEVEATYKTIRYSGKERDASGLHYYESRYYAPWLCRWINPDPAGDIDGLNRYRMVMNNPVTLLDTDGKMVTDATSPPAIQNNSRASTGGSADIFTAQNVYRSSLVMGSNNSINLSSPSPISRPPSRPSSLLIPKGDFFAAAVDIDRSVVIQGHDNLIKWVSRRDSAPAVLDAAVAANASLTHSFTSPLLESRDEPPMSPPTWNSYRVASRTYKSIVIQGHRNEVFLYRQGDTPSPPEFHERDEPDPGDPGGSHVYIACHARNSYIVQGDGNILFAPMLESATQTPTEPDPERVAEERASASRPRRSLGRRLARAVTRAFRRIGEAERATGWLGLRA